MLLLAGGSYNPPHKMHIENFSRVKRYLEKTNHEVYGGVIVPSTMDYLVSKLGKQYAIKLNHRMNMCKIAVQTVHGMYVQVSPHAKPDAEELIHEMLPVVRKMLPRCLLSRILISEIYGADYVVKSELWDAELQFPIFCLPRKGYTEQVLNGLHRSKRKVQNLIFINDEPLDDSDLGSEEDKQREIIHTASSTDIRKVLQSSSDDWSELLELPIMDKRVVQYMIDHQDDLFYSGD